MKLKKTTFFGACVCAFACGKLSKQQHQDRHLHRLRETEMDTTSDKNTLEMGVVKKNKTNAIALSVCVCTIYVYVQRSLFVRLFCQLWSSFIWIMREPAEPNEKKTKTFSRRKKSNSKNMKRARESKKSKKNSEADCRSTEVYTKGKT